MRTVELTCGHRVVWQEWGREGHFPVIGTYAWCEECAKHNWQDGDQWVAVVDPADYEPSLHNYPRHESGVELSKCPAGNPDAGECPHNHGTCHMAGPDGTCHAILAVVHEDSIWEGNAERWRTLEGWPLLACAMLEKFDEFSGYWRMLHGAVNAARRGYEARYVEYLADEAAKTFWRTVKSFTKCSEGMDYTSLDRFAR